MTPFRRVATVIGKQHVGRAARPVGATMPKDWICASLVLSRNASAITWSPNKESTGSVPLFSAENVKMAATALSAKKSSNEKPSKTPVTPEKQPETPETPETPENPTKTPEDKPVDDKTTKKPEKNPVKQESITEFFSGLAGSAGNPGSPGNGDGNGFGHGFSNMPKNSRKKPVHAETYPQLLALPISRRPLFPGFYKAVVITDPQVIAAVEESIKRKQPYVGAFLFKDENADGDVIENIEDVYPVGVFAQITSFFLSKDDKSGRTSMTAVLYPHSRIHLDALIPPKVSRSAEAEAEEMEAETEAEAGAEAEVGGSGKVEEVEKAEKAEKVEKTEKSEKEAASDATVEPKEETAVSEPQTAEADVTSFEKPTDVEKSTEIVAQDSSSGPADFLKAFDVSIINVSDLKDKPYDRHSPVINALVSETLKVFKDISQYNSMFREQIATFSVFMQSATTNIFEEPARLADFAAAVSAAQENELQEVLAALDIEERLQKALIVLRKELMNAQLQDKISKDVEEKINKRQRDYYLMEQLKGIKRELGINDGRDKLIESFKEKAEKLVMPEAVRKVFDDELAKLSTLETAMSEFNVTRNYLDWLTQLPWGLKSKEQYSIPKALAVLDEDHYGMKDVKDRILEFIAVGKLLGSVDGKILCFVGPPGVGKTSIGKSIGRALNRKFYRFSVGGIADVAEIKGHRRTYIGALPGRLIQALRQCQTENPLILIDEIDKIGHGNAHGDPSAALLEVLDPEQNSSFLDHYLDLPVDLSKVLFVCTANITDTIPRPLLDRMEVIELSGYVADEKVKIAENYLIPAAKEMSGLKDADVSVTPDGLAALIKSYCRESGVRNLKKHIEKIFRKAAFNIVKDLPEPETSEDSVEPQASTDVHKVEQKPLEDAVAAQEVVKEADAVPKVAVPPSVHIEVSADNLKDYVGPPVYLSDRLYDTTPPGVVMGLAWTSMGGVAMYIESVLQQPLSHDATPSLDRTGQLGDVMKESSHIAYSFARMFVSRNFPENRFFERAKIHLHCPEGAVPKDGPSAGVTMASSLLSLALNKSLDPTVAMTGELTLTGKVLRIGGLREKVVAAKRSGASTVIFPRDNLADWSDLPENIREGITPVAAEWYQDVYDVLFKDVDTATGNNAWAEEFAKIEKKEKKEKKESRK